MLRRGYPRPHLFHLAQREFAKSKHRIDHLLGLYPHLLPSSFSFQYEEAERSPRLENIFSDMVKGSVALEFGSSPKISTTKSFVKDGASHAFSDDNHDRERELKQLKDIRKQQELIFKAHMNLELSYASTEPQPDFLQSKIFAANFVLRLKKHEREIDRISGMLDDLTSLMGSYDDNIARTASTGGAASEDEESGGE